MTLAALVRYLPALLLFVAGGALCAWILPQEYLAVHQYQRGFPNADPLSLHFRPLVLAAICFLPAIGATLIALAGTLDRYLATQMLLAVGLCALALFLIWFLLDLNDNLSEFQRVENTPAFVLEYYAVVIPYVFMLLIPFALMLGLLYCLGRFSNHREIVAMLQTGRGLPRILAPIGAVGLLLSLLCLLLNYHRAPWGEGYQKALIEYARSGSTSQARNVLYYHSDSGRTWFVGSFPYNYATGEPLQNIQITIKDEHGRPAARLMAPGASWDRETGTWRFENALYLDLQTALLPTFKLLPSPHLVRDWPETPDQIIKPGLVPRYLGIPELRSWLIENQDVEWVDRRTYLTQWQYRWARPWICLVIVLLAAPLGIVFSRRGAAGGIAIAVLLSGSMLVAAEFFLALGDAGYLSPFLAGWGTNLLFLTIAILLLVRRFRGRPIYQTLKNFFPGSD